MNSIINAAKSGWPEKIKKIKELESLMRDFEKLRDSANTLKNLKTEMAWTLVHQKESEVEELEGELAKIQDEISAQEQLLAEKKEQLDQIVAELGKIVEEQAEISNQIRPKEDEKRRLESQLRSEKSQLESFITDSKEINREVQECRRKKVEIEKRIETDSSKEDKNTIKNKLIHEKKENQTALSNLENSLQEINEKERACNNDKMELKGQQERIKRQRHELENSVNVLQRKKQNLENSKSDRLKMYGERMPDAMKAIANHNSFHRAPVGPIGLHCSLKEQKWSLAMEAICGRELDNFIVHDHHDRNQLASILSNHGLNNGILVVNFDKDLSPQAFNNKAANFSSKASMAHDLLEISNKIVLKALVINNSIERALLVDNREEAMNIMKSRPGNIDVTFTTSHQIRAGQKTVSCFALYQNNNGPSFRSNDSAIRFVFVLPSNI